MFGARDFYKGRHQVGNVPELRCDGARLIYDRGPMRDEWSRDAAFMNKMLVEAKGRVAYVGPGHAIALPNIIRAGEDSVVGISDADWPAITCPAWDIVPVRLDDFGAASVV